MTDKPEHSPLPTPLYLIEHAERVWTIQDRPSGAGQPVATQYGHAPKHWGSALVNAVNSHADLVAVCEAFIERLGPDGYYPTAGKPLTDQMRAALAKAKGESK